MRPDPKGPMLYQQIADAARRFVLASIAHEPEGALSDMAAIDLALWRVAEAEYDRAWADLTRLLGLRDISVSDAARELVVHIRLSEGQHEDG